MVVEYTGDAKVLKSLREIFLTLMEGERSGGEAADADDLIEAYGRFAEYPRRQQDTH